MLSALRVQREVRLVGVGCVQAKGKLERTRGAEAPRVPPDVWTKKLEEGGGGGVFVGEPAKL